VARPHGRPLDELVLTVLSQSTNDRNRDVAFLRLRERFPSWEAVRDAPLEEIEEAIRPGGISKVKSARIKSILESVTETSGHGLSLDWLAGEPVPDAQAYLTSLPGVGRKTAACVLLFALGMRDVPVDTHVSRVGTRLGLFRPKAPFREMHDEMLALTPRGADPRAPLAGANPLAKLGAAAIVMVVLFVSVDPITPLVMLGAIAAAVRLSGIPPRTLLLRSAPLFVAAIGAALRSKAAFRDLGNQDAVDIPRQDAIVPNASIIPATVPSKPSNGARKAIVASSPRNRSSLGTSGWAASCTMSRNSARRASCWIMAE